MSREKMLTKRDKKLLFEYLEQNNSNFIDFSIHDDNCYLWKIIFFGPSDSPYKDGRIILTLNIPSDYPFKPPKVQFLTDIYHPLFRIHYHNLSSICAFCTQLNGWTPAITIPTFIQATLDALQNPSKYSCDLNREAVMELARTPELFNQKAAELCRPEHTEIFMNEPGWTSLWCSPWYRRKNYLMMLAISGFLLDELTQIESQQLYYDKVFGDINLRRYIAQFL